MNNSKELPGTFRPAGPPMVVRDSELNGRPVLLLGWWLNARGQVVAVEVATFSNKREPYQVSAYPLPPAAPDPVAPGMPMGAHRNG